VFSIVVKAFQVLMYYSEKDNNIKTDQLPRHLTVYQEIGFICWITYHQQLLMHIILRWTDTNPILSRMRQYTLQGWPWANLSDDFKPFFTRKEELSVLDGCILWGSCVVVPPSGQPQVLESCTISILEHARWRC